MLILALLWASPALACVQIPDVAHVIDPESADVVAPAAPEIGEVAVGRGQGPEPAGCFSSVSTSCDDAGLISIAVSAADDVSAAEDIGYRVELVEGDLPESFTLSTAIWRARDGHLSLRWNDDATDDQEPFDVTLSIVAVDEGGNESQPVEIDVSDPGSTEAGGCDGSGGHLGAGAAILAMLAMRRRRPASPPRERTLRADSRDSRSAGRTAQGPQPANSASR